MRTESVQTQQGKIVWQGTINLDILKRLDRYIERTQQPLEVWGGKRGETYLFTRYLEPPAPPKAAPTLTRAEAFRRRSNVS